MEGWRLRDGRWDIEHEMEDGKMGDREMEDGRLRDGR